MESPTGLKSARQYACEVHAELVRHGVLAEDECTQPEDLSAVADAVIRATGDQRELVERLPIAEFEDAEPNSGHFLAVALLMEGRFRCILTLNFDLALSNALQRLKRGRATPEIAVIRGPRFHGRMRQANLIHLHGAASSPPEEWILTTDKLVENEGGWRRIVTEMVVGTPVTVFAGMGTPVGVVVESVRRIQQELGEESSVFQVDIIDKEDAQFSEALELSDDQYLRGSWKEFTKTLGDFLLQLQLSDLVETFGGLLDAEDWECDDLEQLAEQLCKAGLVFFGLARGAWLGLPGYVPWRELEVSWLAEVLLAVRILEVRGRVEAHICDDGTVDFTSTDRGPSSIRLLHGRGRRWPQVEPPPLLPISSASPKREPLTIVATGGSGPDPSDIAAPVNVVAEADPTSLIEGGSTSRLFTLDQLRAHPELAEEILS